MRHRRLLLSIAALAALVAVLVLGGRELEGYAADFVGGVGRLRAWGPPAFVLGYAVATVAFVPGSVLTLAAGALFGLVDGVLYVFLGALLGSSAAFLIARHLARRPVERRIARDPRFTAIDRAVGREGWKIVFLLRLSPLFPYNLLNYALGITRVRFRDYLAAAPGMLPGTVLYVYAGWVAGDAAALAAGVHAPRGAGYYTLLVAGLAATALVTWRVTRLARRALREIGG